MAQAFRWPFKRSVNLLGAYKLPAGKGSLAVLESQFFPTPIAGGLVEAFWEAGGASGSLTGTNATGTAGANTFTSYSGGASFTRSSGAFGSSGAAQNAINAGSAVVQAEVTITSAVPAGGYVVLGILSDGPEVGLFKTSKFYGIWIEPNGLTIVKQVAGSATNLRAKDYVYIGSGGSPTEWPAGSTFKIKKDTTTGLITVTAPYYGTLTVTDVDATYDTGTWAAIENWTGTVTLDDWKGSIVGASSLTATGTITEGGDSTSAAAVAFLAATGAVTEAGDTLSAAAAATLQAAGAATEAVDISPASAAAALQAAGSVTEAADTVGAGATLPSGLTVNASLAEAADTLSGTAAAALQANSTPTEAADVAGGASLAQLKIAGTPLEGGDIVASGATTASTISGPVAEASDTLQSTAFSFLSAFGAASESADLLDASIANGQAAPKHPGIDIDVGIVAPWAKAVTERAKQSFPEPPPVRNGRLDRALVARAAAQIEQAMATDSAATAQQAEQQVDAIYRDWLERQQRAISDFADQVKARAAFEQLILQRLQLQAAEDEALLLVLANE